MSLYQRMRFLLRARRYRTRHDAGEIAFVRGVLKPGDTAIDIGAHKGAYTYWMARSVGAAGRVMSFEPQPALAAALRERIAELRLSQVSIEQMALSKSTGEATLHVPGDSPSPGASLESRAGSGGQAVRVRLSTLDEHLASRPHGRVALIKCDVEGHELDVFQGAARTLIEHGPVLLFECETRHHPDGNVAHVFEFLQGLGYRGRFILDGRLRPLAEFDAVKHQVFGREPYVNNFVFESA